ncbi:hypothetical protein [Pseudoduganella rhizocola]|uniref:hypothetical protein n=1 Tax=Pseudoduganella rhizocola TaxID=3382643 RepID=UPI0038B45268
MESLLSFLYRLYPPDAVIHIGAGTGTGRMHAWQAWAVPNALLVDADEARLAWVRGRQQQYPDWHPVCALLDREVQVAAYHTASNPAESGLLPPADLTSLWPNLRSVQVAEVPTQTVDALLTSPALASFANAASTWLLVDCFPAQRILQGAVLAMQRSSLIWARTLAADWPGTADGAGEQEVLAFLAAQGFRCVDRGEGNHPAVRELLFVRDWQAALASSLRQQVLSQAELQALRDELSAAQAAVAGVRAEQAAMQAPLDGLREEIRVLAEEKNALLAECASLRNELAGVRTAAEIAAATHAETDGRMADLNSRQKLLSDELLKAEAQLELMKDVLLREIGD